MERISVIVPVYNVEKYLDECVQSILNQTYDNIELVLVDDGSTDGSSEICDKYGKIDSRVKVIHKENRGVSSARNKGLDIAKGEFIVFIDSDDCIHPQMIEILYEGIKENNSDISICEYKRYQENEVIENKIYNKDIINFNNYTNIEGLHNLQKEKRISFTVPWNKLYKKNLFDNLRYYEGKIHEDEFIIHELLYKCNLISYTSLKLYYYLKRDNSIMGSQNNLSYLDGLDAYSERIKFYKKINQIQFIKDLELIYVNHFLDFYNRIKNGNENNKKQVMNEMIKRLRIRIFGILKNSGFTIKEKILFIILCITPNIYENYLMIKNKSNKK